MPDPDLLSRATELGRPLFTHDDDLLAEASYRHGARIGVGQTIDDLELVAKLAEPEDLHSEVLFLPL